MTETNQKTSSIRPWVTALTLCLSIVAWGYGMFQSQIWDPQVREEKRYLASFLRDSSADRSLEQQLAKAYWLRYEDIRSDSFFGENGPGGIYGAREHYQLHGRHEGRIFGPLTEPADPEKERVLAEAYWNRYGDVADSPIWGRNSSLGILGPRDHYHYIGKKQNRVWGEAAQQHLP